MSVSKEPTVSTTSTPPLRPIGFEEEGSASAAPTPTPPSRPSPPLSLHPAASQPSPNISDPDALRNLIVNYLPPFMDEAQLHQLFSQFGPIDRVKIIYDKITGESRGYGFVLFQFFFSATYAISYLNRFTIAGKKLKVGYANAEAAKEAYDLMKLSVTAFSARQQQALEYMYHNQLGLAQGGEGAGGYPSYGYGYS